MEFSKDRVDAFRAQLAQTEVDYGIIEQGAYAVCEDLCRFGLSCRVVRKREERAVPSVVYEVQKYLGLPFVNVPMSWYVQNITKKNLNNLVPYICKALPKAEKQKVEESIRAGLKRWLDFVESENKE